MNNDKLERYCRQMIVSGFDIEGQELLSKATVLIIGIGGLGCPAAQYLAGAGVGRLLLADDDIVEVSNLPRQTLFTEMDLKQKKTTVAKKKLALFNPEVKIETVTAKLTEDSLPSYVKKADVVLDCTDSFESRFAANSICFQHKVPLVFGSAIRMQGQLSVFDFRDDEAPCLGCIYQQDTCHNDSCLSSGIIGPVTGTIGSMMALAALQLLIGNYKKQAFHKNLLLFDANNWCWNKIKLTKDEQCSVCSQEREYTS